MKSRERIYNLSRGVESLTKEEHGLFFDAAQRLRLRNEVKQAAVALYLDFKKRPVGIYVANKKELDVFLIASISLAAKAMGDLRTDLEFESKMFVNREKLVDAEERILKSFRIQDSLIPVPEFVSELTRRQIESMAEGFAERGLISGSESEELVWKSIDYLDTAVKRGLSPKMSYRGRAAGAVLKAAREMDLQIPEADIARSAGFDKRSMTINTSVIDNLLKDSKC